MTVTPTLREMDAGILLVGTTSDAWEQWIPGGLSNAHNAAFMTTECSQNAFPDEGIKVYGSMLHSHTAGKALRTRVIRNGKELAPIDINLVYEFSFEFHFHASLKHIQILRN